MMQARMIQPAAIRMATATHRHYSAYETLLDTFQNYLDAEKTYYKYFTSENPSLTVDEWCDKLYVDLINRINRVPYTSEAAERGTAFNELVDALLKKPLAKRLEEGDLKSGKISFEVVTLDLKVRRKADPVTQKDAYKCVLSGKDMAPQEFTFFKDVVDDFVNYYEGAVPQVFCHGTLETDYGPIDLYGFIDELLPFSVHDIKTTKSYRSGAFKAHWQHIVYPYCLHCMGMDISHFEYNVTNFKETFSEVYVFDESRDIPRLREHCERLIQFLEDNKDVITDTKVFNPLNK